MRSVCYGLAIVALSQPFPSISSPLPSTLQIAQAPKSINTLIPVSLPVRATVWLKAGGSTIGQVMGFDPKQQVLTLGGSPIRINKIDKVVFDRKAVAYHSDGRIVIRGDDTAKATQSTWRNLALSAFQLKDPNLGQAQVNLAGVRKPLEIKGIQSVAVKSVYVVDEIQFQSPARMTIKVTPSDPRPSQSFIR